MDLKHELLNFSYRKVEIPFNVIFPKVNPGMVRKKFIHLVQADPHKTIYSVARELWKNGYNSILSEFGFYDSKYSQFSGHCHQCTPALGLVLHALGFSVSYLECFRIREHFTSTSIIEQIPPTEELNAAVRDEFCSIKRIPYCCLEVMIDGKPYYLTGKHLKPKDDGAVALLTPKCYRDFVGVFKHQNDFSKSGIYLKADISNDGRIIWMKQTYNDKEPELFAEFLRMNLI